MPNLVDNSIDTFVCELARIDRLGSNRRLLFTVPSVDSEGWQSIVVKLIVSADCLPKLIRMLETEAYDRTGVAPELLALETTNAN